ncbi:sensor histidine kinase [Microbacterium sp. NPDC055455]
MTDRSLTAAGCAVGIAVTALVLWSPIVSFGYRNPSLHLVLDTVDACVALLVAYLVYGRYSRAGRLQDLLLCVGLVLLAVAGLGLTAVAGALLTEPTGRFEVWLPIGVRVLGGLLIVAAALVRDRSARQLVPHRPATTVFGAVAFAVVLCALALWSVRLELPLALDPAYIPTSTDPPFAGAHPLLIAGQAVAAASFFIASASFTVQATERDDELLRWLGPACALGGFARLNYALFPSLYTDWLYTGDFLRTGCYLLLLIGAMREMNSYWTAQARAAVLDDRRRLARELHDGVVQELGYIRAESHALPTGSPNALRIIAACDRGLDEARSAVNALGRTVEEEPFGFTLHRAVRELSERYRVNLEVDVDDSITADSDQRHALMRIAREAVSNAVRHGKAERIWVRLSRDGGARRLTVEDDGTGFDVDATIAAGSGYGLISMRDRAQGLPGVLSMESHRGKGSVVTVAW